MTSEMSDVPMSQPVPDTLGTSPGTALTSTNHEDAPNAAQSRDKPWDTPDQPQRENAGPARNVAVSQTAGQSLSQTLSHNPPPTGVTAPAGTGGTLTVDGDADGQPLEHSSAGPRVMAPDDLDGATDVGDLRAWCSSAGEFAARWNRRPPAIREEDCQALLADREVSEPRAWARAREIVEVAS